jgi:hypothetical protein
MKTTGFHHFVPRFYLEAFLDPLSLGKKNFEPYLWVVDVRSQKIRKKSPQNIAGQKGFYDMQATLHRPDGTFEKLYSQIEGPATPIIRKLLDGNIVLTDDEKKSFLRFICFQKTRGQNIRQEMTKILQDDDTYRSKRHSHSQMLDKLKRRTNYPEILEGFIERVETDIMIRRGVEEGKDYFDKISSATLSMKWTFLLSMSDADGFITSDNPVGFHGVNDELEEVQLPISPKCLLLINNNDRFADGLFPVDKTFVEGANRVHLKRVYQHVFCFSREQSEWVIRQAQSK